MKKVFISQPMRGLTNEEILATRNLIKEKLEDYFNEPIEVLDSFIPIEPGSKVRHNPVWYLGRSIMLLAEADIIYFARDWEHFRGCKIEYEVAMQYGIPAFAE